MQFKTLLFKYRCDINQAFYVTAAPYSVKIMHLQGSRYIKPTFFVTAIYTVHYKRSVHQQNRLRCKTLCDVLYDTLGEFGAIQAQAVAKIFTIDVKSIPLRRVLAKSRISCFSAGRPLKQQRLNARSAP